MNPQNSGKETTETAHSHHHHHYHRHHSSKSSKSEEKGVYGRLHRKKGSSSSHHHHHSSMADIEGIIIYKDGRTEKLPLKLPPLTDEERDIILSGCLIISCGKK